MAKQDKVTDKDLENVSGGITDGTPGRGPIDVRRDFGVTDDSAFESGGGGQGGGNEDRELNDR